MKRCPRCQRTLPHAGFSKYHRSKDGLQYHCKDCARVRRAATYAANRESELQKNTEYRAANIERIAASHATNRLRRYGLTDESYAALLAKQGGRCAVCRGSEPGGRYGRWHVDHDHSCCGWSAAQRALCGGCVRGLLCGTCNSLLGMARDSTVTLYRAIEYLQEPPAERLWGDDRPKDPNHLT